MESINIINKTYAVILVLLIASMFSLIGIIYSKKYLNISNYLVANRSISTFYLSTSFIASSLGAWVLFGPASAATWGGIGSVIGYALGSAFPFFLLLYLGKKFRTEYPNGKTLIEVIRLKFGKNLFKLILLLSIFYMTVFLIAEVTAVSILVKYISDTPLWITALIIIISSLLYTLYGGLRASIFTDNLQFLFFIILLIFSFLYIIFFHGPDISFNPNTDKKIELIGTNIYTNFTSGFIFFIAVATTNLFHQGNWQRVYAAKNNQVLKKSLLISFFLVIPIVFFIGFTGLIAKSLNPDIYPDLAFFSLIISEHSILIASTIIFLGISLTVSSIDTIINAISSLIIVDGNKVINKNYNFKKTSKVVIFLLSIITFIVASKGISILYLFLLADLFCCAAAFSVFINFYKKSFDEKNIYISIFFGLFSGFLFFPTPDFSSPLLLSIFFSSDFLPKFLSNNLLFYSFFTATFIPLLFLKKASN